MSLVGLHEGGKDGTPATEEITKLSAEEDIRQQIQALEAEAAKQEREMLMRQMEARKMKERLVAELARKQQELLAQQASVRLQQEKLAKELSSDQGVSLLSQATSPPLHLQLTPGMTPIEPRLLSASEMKREYRIQQELNEQLMLQQQQQPVLKSPWESLASETEAFIKKHEKKMGRDPERSVKGTWRSVETMGMSSVSSSANHPPPPTQPTVPFLNNSTNDHIISPNSSHLHKESLDELLRISASWDKKRRETLSSQYGPPVARKSSQSFIEPEQLTSKSKSDIGPPSSRRRKRINLRTSSKINDSPLYVCVSDDSQERERKRRKRSLSRDRRRNRRRRRSRSRSRDVRDRGRSRSLGRHRNRRSPRKRSRRSSSRSPQRARRSPNKSRSAKSSGDPQSFNKLLLSYESAIDSERKRSRKDSAYASSRSKETKGGSKKSFDPKQVIDLVGSDKEIRRKSREREPSRQKRVKAPLVIPPPPILFHKRAKDHSEESMSKRQRSETSIAPRKRKDPKSTQEESMDISDDEASARKSDITSTSNQADPKSLSKSSDVSKPTNSSEVSASKYAEIMRNIALFTKQTNTNPLSAGKKPPVVKGASTTPSVLYPTMTPMPFPAAQPGFPLMLPPGLVPQVLPPGADYFSYYQQMPATGFPQHPHLHLNPALGPNGNMWPPNAGNHVQPNFNQLVPPNFNQQIYQNQMNKLMPNGKMPPNQQMGRQKPNQQVERQKHDVPLQNKARGSPHGAQPRGSPHGAQPRGGLHGARPRGSPHGPQRYGAAQHGRFPPDHAQNKRREDQRFQSENQKYNQSYRGRSNNQRWQGEDKGYYNKQQRDGGFGFEGRRYGGPHNRYEEEQRWHQDGYWGDNGWKGEGWEDDGWADRGWKGDGWDGDGWKDDGGDQARTKSMFLRRKESELKRKASALKRKESEQAKSKDSGKQKEGTNNQKNPGKGSFFLSKGKRDIPPRHGTQNGSQSISESEDPDEKTKSKPGAGVQKKRRLLKKGGKKEEAAKTVDSKIKKARKRTLVAKKKAQMAQKARMAQKEEEDAGDFHEQSLKAKPLLVVFRDSKFVSKNGSKWTSMFEDDSLRAYASFIANPFDPKMLKEWFKTAEENTAWEQPRIRGSLLPRKAAWFVKPGCKCYYKYSDTKWPPNPMPTWFTKIQDEVMKCLGIPLKFGPNSCNVNLYYSGLSSVGWHSDDEPVFESKKRDCLIVSLSLGTSRKFQFKRQGNEKLAGDVWVKNGDLMTMEGLFQKHFLHRVPKMPSSKGKRINFTWRWVTAHDKSTCTRKHVWALGHFFGIGQFPKWHPRNLKNRGKRKNNYRGKKNNGSIESQRGHNTRGNNRKRPRHNPNVAGHKSFKASSFFLGGSK